jgi:hypothetical protein
MVVLVLETLERYHIGVGDNSSLVVLAAGSKAVSRLEVVGYLWQSLDCCFVLLIVLAMVLKVGVQDMNHPVQSVNHPGMLVLTLYSVDNIPKLKKALQEY